jgi:hypothetical protein
MSILLRFWREGIILSLLCVVGVGYYLWPVPPNCPAPETKIVTQVHTVTETKTVVQKPDGTVITKVSDTHEDEKSKTDEKPSYTPPILSRYTLGVSVPPLDYKNVNVQIGARLGDLPVFGTASYEIGSHTATVGLMVEIP